MAGTKTGAESSGGWIAINTHTHKERIALEHLSRQDFVAYCPMLTARVRHARRTRDVLRPLFPGYVFAALAADGQRWRPLLSTVGVRSIVRAGERLSYLPSGFIESLRQREINGAIVHPASPYRVGQDVRVVSGPFDGAIARIIGMDERERLIVLMEILNRRVKVQLAATSVSEVIT